MRGSNWNHRGEFWWSGRNYPAIWAFIFQVPSLPPIHNQSRALWLCQDRFQTKYFNLKRRYCWLDLQVIQMREVSDEVKGLGGNVKRFLLVSWCLNYAERNTSGIVWRIRETRTTRASLPSSLPWDFFPLSPSLPPSFTPSLFLSPFLFLIWYLYTRNCIKATKINKTWFLLQIYPIIPFLFPPS